MTNNKKWIVLREDNDHEGETWFFYVSEEENPGLFEFLEEKITNMDEFEYYYIFRVELDECSLRNMPQTYGYMNKHNIIEGIIDLDELADIDDWEDCNPLYKGGLKDFVKKEKYKENHVNH